MARKVIFGAVYIQCVELVAGRAAERMLLHEEPAVPADDIRQARELALLICFSDEAIATFIAHCDIVARDLLTRYGDVVIALSVVLRIKRTLDGAEIDQIIRDMEAQKALAVEHQRRVEWRERELAAGRFRAECEHVSATSLSQLA